MTDLQILACEDEIRDLRRIIEADQAVLELEKSAQKRTALIKEIGELEDKVEGLLERLECLRHN